MIWLRLQEQVSESLPDGGTKVTVMAEGKQAILTREKLAALLSQRGFTPIEGSHPKVEQPSSVLEGTLDALPENLERFDIVFDCKHPGAYSPSGMLEGQFGDILDSMGLTWGNARTVEGRFLIVSCYPHGAYPVNIPFGKQVIDAMLQGNNGFYIKPSR